MSTDKVVFLCKDISKIFPGVKALDNVDFQLKAGEICGLVGRNGAGKTTLVNIIYGKLQPTSGRMYLDGNPISLGNPIDGLKAGIAMVPQEPMVFPNLTIAENLSQPNFPRKNKAFISWKQVYKRCAEVLKELDISLEPDKVVSELSIGQQQLLSIGKAFFVSDAKIVLLDEVTTSINVQDKEILYAMIRKKKEEGGVIVFISHNVNEIFEICDNVAVMQDGKVVKVEQIKNTTPNNIIQAMFGENYKSTAIEPLPDWQVKDTELLVVANLTRYGEYSNISFSVRKNEILGLAGLCGSGKSELLRTLTGLCEPHEGRICFMGKETKIKCSNQARKMGIAYLPEDREKDGLISMLSVCDNLTISSLHKMLKGLGFINTKHEISRAQHLVEMFRITTPTLDQQVMYLSGGNKQKVLFGRLYENQPQLYLLDEPTRGIDVETKQEILRVIRQQLVEGSSSIVITSPEIEDLLIVCDRLLVLFEGNVVGILEKPFDPVKLFAMMQGVSGKKHAARSMQQEACSKKHAV